MDLEIKPFEEQTTAEIEKAIAADQNSVPYVPMSKLPNMGTVVPLSLAGETMQAQFKLREEIEDVDQYLVEKLKYTSKYALSQAFSAEQADAAALAIYQIEKGKGFVLADMAGIGKGRINASILRYAKVNGYLPIFITEKTNLFSAMYRDLLDIGGIETKSGGKMNVGYPLILNGYKSGGVEYVEDDNGKRTKVQKPSETGIVDFNGKEVIQAPAQAEIKKMISKGTLPAQYDYIELTYSQLSGSAGKPKVEYLSKLIQQREGKVVICMDECHNATGTKSDTGKAITSLIDMVKGVLFSSATFSKRPDNMFIYALKTDISTSALSTAELIKVIQLGGERLTENLAANLTASGQMIRRQRTFEHCSVVYEYMQDADKEELFSKYDLSVKLFRELVRFFSPSNSLFHEAKKVAIRRFAKLNKVEWCEEPRPRAKADLAEWERENKGKYTLRYFTAGNIVGKQFNFIETLLFALKADFVAKQTLGQLLDNQLINTRVADKVEFKSNRKPVIAVRNTLEGIYDSLGVEVGEELDSADFSVYVYSLALSALSGSITLKEIVPSDKDNEPKLVTGDISIEDEDFTDNGVAYKEILERVKAVELNIPLSPIDRIIDMIEETPRPSWDMEHGGGTPFFTVGEVTGRKFRLKKQPNGKYKLLKNEKPKNKSTTFKMFNNGTYDVLLINESGSTGEDAHSSSKFKDQRPRVMVIHQVELDVNTEVQKRGRINRTGMVNYPNYIYAVSRIPSEIRRLLMLIKKLRSLDANITANQKQSSELTSIKDSFGNDIKDVINKYGDEVLDDFMSIELNSERYGQFMPTDEQGVIREMTGEYLIETFVRNLEMGLSDEQEYFYNSINALYVDLENKLKESGEYDLETNIIDLKASIKTRLLVSKGGDTNPFDAPVYIEDDYVLAEDKPYSKDKVEGLVLSLAGGKEPDAAYLDFVSDYKKHYAEHVVAEVKDSILVPDYSLAKDEMERMKMEAEYDLKVNRALARAKDEYESVLAIIEAKDKNGKMVLMPNRPAAIPEVVEECYELDSDGLPMGVSSYNNARFVGVIIHPIAKEKYSPMNIELVFCQLSGKPKVSFKPTNKGRQVLEYIVSKSMDLEITRIVMINNWVVDLNRRAVVRMLTGNVLEAYGIAVSMTKADDKMWSKVIKFLKFTTADRTSLRIGIKLSNKMPLIPMSPQNTPIKYALNSSGLVDDVINSDKRILFTNENESFVFLYDKYNTAVRINIFGGTRKESKSKKKSYYSELYDDGQFVRLLDNMGISYRRYDMWYKPRASSRNVALKTLDFTVYVDRESGAKILGDVLKYIHSKTPFMISLTGVEDKDQILNAGDVPLNKEEIDSDQFGDYGYDTLKQYDSVKGNIMSMSKFDRHERTSAYGTVYLSRRASVNEAANYGLIPLNNSIADMVSDTFAVLTSDSDKIRFKEAIAKAVAESKSDYEIGNMVQKALYGKIISLKTIFGYDADNISFIGGVFKKYANGEVGEIERKKMTEEDLENQSKPLTLDTAEEFMILFTHKIKNR